MEYKDYYKLLGVDRKASAKDIKSAYRKLARKYHPDVNPGDTAAEVRFKEINEANAVLSDPDKRKKYDTLGPDWERRFQQRYQPQGGPQSRPGDGAGDFSDFFETLFGQRTSTATAPGGFEFDLGSLFGRGRGKRPEPQGQIRGQDVEQPVEITLREALSGVEKAFTVQTSQACSACQGTGLKDNSLCSTCGGSRAVPRTKRLEVKIPAGVREGSRIRVAGEGNPGGGAGTSGDLYLVVRMVPDPSFRREGDDLYTETQVPVTTLVLGGEVDAPTVNGRVTIRVPAESQNGRTLRLGSQGMPRLKGGGRGDLYVKLNASLPTELNDRQKELFQQLEQSGV